MAVLVEMNVVGAVTMPEVERVTPSSMGASASALFEERSRWRHAMSSLGVH